MIHRSWLRHKARWLVACLHRPQQEDLVPSPQPSLTPYVGLPHHQPRHNVLHRWLQVADLCYQHRGDKGDDKPTLFYLGEVGRWETTGHCSPEIKHVTVHLSYPPVLAPPCHKCELEMRWLHWTEPLKSWESGWTPIHLRPSCQWLCRACHEGP